jgi:uncharacterized lipoprotein YajG
MKKVFFVLAAMLMFGCDKETTATTATPDVVSDVDAVSGSDAGTDSVASDAVTTPTEDVTVTQSTEVTPTK